MKNTILTLAALVLFSCCSKDNGAPQDQLPPITQTGANTAGCIINGKILIPKNGDRAIGGPALYGLTTGAGIDFHPPIIGDDYFYVWVQNYKDTDGYDIYIHIDNMVQGTGNYTVGQSNGQKFRNALASPQVMVETHYGITPSKKFISSPNSGTITITRFEYNNGIYSGIFNCTLYNEINPTETMQVTDGRFDINIATLNH